MSRIRLILMMLMAAAASGTEVIECGIRAQFLTFKLDCGMDCVGPVVISDYEDSTCCRASNEPVNGIVMCEIIGACYERYSGSNLTGLTMSLHGEPLDGVDSCRRLRIESPPTFTIATAVCTNCTNEDPFPDRPNNNGTTSTPTAIDSATNAVASLTLLSLGLLICLDT